MTSPSWFDMVDAYVLGALAPDERVAFEAQLANDPALQARVAGANEAALALAEGLPDAKLPESLRASVLARARSVREPVAGATGTAGGAIERAEDPRRSGADPGTGPRPKGRAPVAPWVLLAASVAGLAFLGYQNTSLTREADRLTQELELIRGELGTANASLARLDSLAQAVSGEDVRFATLTGDAAPSLRLLWNPERALLVVAASNLPEPEAGRTYQLWGIGGAENPVGLGTFRTDASGTALVTLSGVPAGAFEVSAVTEEPDGGSPQPTTTPFLVGSWSSSQD